MARWSTFPARRSNLAFESQHLLHAVEAAGIKNWVSLSEGQQGTLGWLTTNERKQQMCLLLREALTVGRIATAHEFFSNELNIAEAKMRIKDELSSYCVVTEPPKTTFGKVTRPSVPQRAPARRPHTRRSRVAGADHIHRKTLRYCKGNSNRTHHQHAHTRSSSECTPAGKQDDLCIAIQLSLIGCQKFFQESKYRNFRADDYLTPNGLALNR